VRQRPRAIRLLGVALSNLVPHDQQLTLFERAALQRAVDAVRARYGYDAMRIALAVARRER
jgi:hypothetical protein